MPWIDHHGDSLRNLLLKLNQNNGEDGMKSLQWPADSIRVGTGIAGGLNSYCYAEGSMPFLKMTLMQMNMIHQQLCYPNNLVLGDECLHPSWQN